jgi:multiple sugar transport system permease protein
MSTLATQRVRIKKRTNWGRIAAWGAMGLLIFVSLFPFFWMIRTALSTNADLVTGSQKLVPDNPTLLNVRQALGLASTEELTKAGTLTSADVNFFTALRNSVIVCTLITLGQVTFCSMAAYAFARLRFPGRDALFLIVLATTMVPSEITLIPNFVTIRRFPLAGGNDIFGSGGSGLYDTYPAMILPFLAGAFNIFLLRQAFMRVPNEYWEAAQLDGSGGLGFLWRILLPLTVPALFTVALFGFLGRWNALLWPLIVTRSESMRPVQVAMIYYQNEFQTNYGMVMAAAFMVTLPIIVVFVLAQKNFIAGISSVGLKG